MNISFGPVSTQMFRHAAVQVAYLKTSANTCTDARCVSSERVYVQFIETQIPLQILAKRR